MDCNCKDQDHEGEEFQHDHHEHNEETEIMYLTLEDGTKIKSEVVTIFEIEEQDYIVLLPEESENVYLYRYDEIEGEPLVSIIEDDNEYDQAAEVYNSMLEEAEAEAEEE